MAGEHVGIGVGAYLERSGLGPRESASVSVSGDGDVVVRSGATALGQGLHGVLTQIAAEQLGLSPQEITAQGLDTTALATGLGTYASRSTVMAGNAVRQASLAAIEQARPYAASALSIEAEDLVIADGQFKPADSSAGISLKEAAALAARENGTGLLASETFHVERATFTHGAVAAIVRIDPELGAVRVERLVLGYDVGRAVNPRLVEGQLHGAAVQALGGTLLEQFIYDEHGNPLATTFFDYLLPSLGDAPEMTVLIEENRATSNPLGVAGAARRLSAASPPPSSARSRTRSIAPARSARSRRPLRSCGARPRGQPIDLAGCIDVDGRLR